MLPAGSWATRRLTSVLLLGVGLAWGQNGASPNAAGELAPAQDKGIAGLQQALASLRTPPGCCIPPRIPMMKMEACSPWRRAAGAPAWSC